MSVSSDQKAEEKRLKKAIQDLKAQKKLVQTQRLDRLRGEKLEETKSINDELSQTREDQMNDIGLRMFNNDNNVRFIFGPAKLFLQIGWLKEKILESHRLNCFNQIDSSYGVADYYFEESLDTSDFIGMCLLDMETICSICILKKYDRKKTNLFGAKKLANLDLDDATYKNIGNSREEMYLDVMCGAAYKNSVRFLLYVFQRLLRDDGIVKFVRIFSVASAKKFWTSMGYEEIEGSPCIATPVKRLVPNYYVDLKTGKDYTDDGEEMKFCLSNLDSVWETFALSRDIRLVPPMTQQQAMSIALANAWNKTFTCFQQECLLHFFKDSGRKPISEFNTPAALSHSKNYNDNRSFTVPIVRSPSTRRPDTEPRTQFEPVSLITSQTKIEEPQKKTDYPIDWLTLPDNSPKTTVLPVVERLVSTSKSQEPKVPVKPYSPEKLVLTNSKTDESKSPVPTGKRPYIAPQSPKKRRKISPDVNEKPNDPINGNSYNGEKIMRENRDRERRLNERNRRNAF